MQEKRKSALSPTRKENFSEWFHVLIKEAELADSSSVKGCMVIRPWGLAIWKRMESILDRAIQASGHENAYFPLFVPINFLDKESSHISGFATECAVVTHRRLEKNAEGKFIPASPLAEPLVVRPTSETIIGEMFSRWIHSHRDLPLLINQWANVVRWEMRTRPFLRTSEFLWQEGHTAHATADEALKETTAILEMYAQFTRNSLAIHAIEGKKTESEKFPGAEQTYCIEGLMQDGKALQMGTSHFFGTTFSKSFNIQFANANGTLQYPYTTSWGVSTRLVGACIMAHSDDDGLILPPDIAPKHIVLLPIHRDKDCASVQTYCDQLCKQLQSHNFRGESLRVLIDRKEESGGNKKWKWIRKGVPLIIEIGNKELSKQQITLIKRDDLYGEKITIPVSQLCEHINSHLEQLHDTLLRRSREWTESNICMINNKEDFFSFFSQKDRSGLALCHYGSDEQIEQSLKERFHVTPRCIPLTEENHGGLCIFSGKPTQHRVLIGRAY